MSRLVKASSVVNFCEARSSFLVEFSMYDPPSYERYLSSSKKKTWGLFLERAEDFSGPKSELSNCSQLGLKS